MTEMNGAETGSPEAITLNVDLLLAQMDEQAVEIGRLNLMLAHARQQVDALPVCRNTS